MCKVSYFLQKVYNLVIFASYAALLVSISSCWASICSNVLPEKPDISQWHLILWWFGGDCEVSGYSLHHCCGYLRYNCWMLLLKLPNVLYVGMRLLCSKNWALCFWAVLQKSPIILLRNAHYSQNYATDFCQ